MNKYLIVVDMQNDFISGSLGTDEAKAILPAVKKKIEETIGNKSIFFTMDTHFSDYLETPEGKALPVPHCIKDTEGWEIAHDLLDVFESRKLKPASVIKNTFGSVELAHILEDIDRKEKIKEIELIGLCTDICVISNALLLKAFFPGIKISVDASCCAGVTPASHENALDAMKMCQIEII